VQLAADIQQRLQKVQQIKADLDQIQRDRPLAQKVKATGRPP